MTFATTLAAGTRQQVDITLFIDGIPVLFGTRAGLVLSMAALVDNVGSYGTLTSVNAIMPESVSFDGQELDYDLLMVPPSGASMSIRLEQSGETWDKYFERRRTPRTRITALMDHNDLLLYVSANDFAAGLLYLDRETLEWDGSGTTLMSGLTRNVLGLPLSRAEVHHAKSFLSSVPRYLEGRMCVVHLWLDGIVSKVYAYAKIAKSPSKSADGGAWEIEFEDMMTLFSRKCAVGFEGCEITGKVVTGTTAQLFPVESTRELRNHAGDPGSLMISGPQVSADQVASFKIVPATFATSYAAVSYVDVGSFEINFADSMRRCYVFRDPMLAALQIMLSDTGDGSNHATYDVMFGVTPAGTGLGTTQVANDETELRFGAGLPPGLIDITTLETFIGKSPAGWVYILGSKGEESLLDILREVARALSGYWCVVSGQLTFKYFDGTYETDTIAASATEANILDSTPRKSIDDESEVVTTITTKCNWSPYEGEFKGVVTVVYPELAAVYGDSRTKIEQERRGVYVGLPSQDTAGIINGVAVTPASTQQILSASERIFYRRCQGLRKWTLHLPFSFIEVVPGDKITLTWDQLADFTGSYPSGAVVEVTGKEVDIRGGMVTLQVTETHVGKVISPSLEVKAWVDPTITFDTSCKFHADATPSNWLAVGWKCRIWDASDNFATVKDFIVATIPSTNSITVDAMVGFTPEAPDIVTVDIYDDADNTTANAAQTLGQRSYVFMADGTYTLGAAKDEAHRWG